VLPQSVSMLQLVGHAGLAPLHRNPLQPVPGLPLGKLVHVPLSVAPKDAAQTSQPPPQAVLQQ
jgi:hypothetical protein